jgi:thiosulfate/3-mercaptopyruvate sulfurtransferase
MKWLKAFLMIAILFLPLTVLAKGIDPIVSADWLQKNLKTPNLVIVDLRKVEDYQAGHIPGSVNVFYGSWAIKAGTLLNELPPLDDLSDVIGGAGIGSDSTVVLVGKTEKVPEQFDMTRVAWTLRYMGVEDVGILSGGITQWVKENKPVSTEAVKAKAKPFKAAVNKGLFVDKAYVLGKLGKATILDTRGPAFYEGKEKLEFVPKTGHIKGAINLPVGQLFTPEGLYKSNADLAALAEKAAGKDLSKEIIVYCDTGKTCTGWAFIMTKMLGYKDVKVYDGSFMEWAADATDPVEP